MQPIAEATRAEALHGVSPEDRDCLILTLNLIKSNLQAATHAPLAEKETTYG